MKDQNRICIVLLFSIIWICKPIPYSDIARKNLVGQEILILRAGGQGQDSRDSGSGFISSTSGARKSDSVDQQNLQPKKQKITYKPPSGPGGFGAGNIDADFPEIPDPKDTISDPEFWGEIFDQEPADTEDDPNPKQSKVPTPPTYNLVKKAIKEHDYIENQIEPFSFKDWEGEIKKLHSREMKKSIFSHGFEAGISTESDLVLCPLQPDPTKYQPRDCSKITKKNMENLRNKIVDSITSTGPGKAKLKIKMPYYDTEIATAHLDIYTGECFFFHGNGKYWGYKKYNRREVTRLIGKAQKSSTLKWASPNFNYKSEL